MKYYLSIHFRNKKPNNQDANQREGGNNTQYRGNRQ